MLESAPTPKPSLWQVGGLEISRVTQDEDLTDSRGLLLVWEPPSEKEDYVIGVDPTMGKTGWSRRLRHLDDKNSDNAAIEVLCVGRLGQRDRQVAEFAAPIDAQDLAQVVNAVGTMFRGRSEHGQAHVIVETYGSGVMCLGDLMNKHGYQNLWWFTQIGGRGKAQSSSPGWQPSRENNKALFMNALRHIDRDRVQVKSPWLVDELADCTFNWIDSTLRARWGLHDDRVRAFFLALWAAHGWASVNAEDRSERIDKPQRLPRPEATDMTWEEMMEDSDSGFSNLLETLDSRGF